MTSMTRLRLWTASLAAALVLGTSGCATNGDPRDPLEPMNRAIFHFNDGFDALLVKPAAELYTGRLIPEFVRTGLRNFFSNINDVIVALNDLLQGKFSESSDDLGRIIINTTAGVLGFMDVATDAGLQKRTEDFGQTLGVWGFGGGPYIVLPILGPSNVRDTVGWVGDIYMWPITYVKPHSTRNALIVTRFVGIRADLLAATNVLEAAALDRYTFVRDAYLQRRRNLIYDGNPPPEDFDQEPEKPGASNQSGVNSATDPFDGTYSLFPTRVMWYPVGLKASHEAPLAPQLNVDIQDAESMLLAQLALISTAQQR